jgi:uncharacterized membrane protein (UPF0136 family)
MKHLTWFQLVFLFGAMVAMPSQQVLGFASPGLLSNTTKSRLMFPMRADYKLGLVFDNIEGGGLPPRGVALNSFVGGLTFFGGAMGFVKKGSKASLIAGSGFGGLLLISAALIFKQNRKGNVMGSSIAGLLTYVMGKKFLVSKKIMPAGLTAFFGALALVYNAIEVFSNKYRNVNEEDGN